MNAQEVTAAATIRSERKEVYYVSSTALLIFDNSVLDTGLHTQVCLMIVLLHCCTQAEQHAPEELERQHKTINIRDSKSDGNVDLGLPARDPLSVLQPWHKYQPNEVPCALFIKTCPIGGTKRSHYKNPERINCYCRSSLSSPSPLHAKSTPTKRCQFLQSLELHRWRKGAGG